MTEAATTGRWAEGAALDYLQTRGLKPLQRNFRQKFGELDIIMEDGD
ncbi:MAG: YraN family protein, partial [Pseudomonadales bacterium]